MDSPSIDDRVDIVMERVRLRQAELARELDNNPGSPHPNNAASVQIPLANSQNLGNIQVSAETAAVLSKQVNKELTSPNRHDDAENVSPKKLPSSARKARFSALAQELDDFECDYKSPYNKPKEAYMKGASPRLSIGETRPAVLCTPAGQASMRSPNIAKTPTKNEVPVSHFKNSPSKHFSTGPQEERRITFALPIANVNYLPNESSVTSNESTILGGSSEMTAVTTSTFDCSMGNTTTENTLYNAQTTYVADNPEETFEPTDTSLKYGAHTFMKKKTPLKDECTPQKQDVETTPVATTTSSSSSLQALMRSPKPFTSTPSRSHYSPVQFNPQSTSSPKTSTTTHEVQMTATISADRPMTMTSGSVSTMTARLLTPTTPSYLRLTNEENENISAAKEVSPSTAAARQSAAARTMALRLEQRLKEAGGQPLPTPRHVPSMKPTTPLGKHTPTVRADIFNEQKKEQDVDSSTLPPGVQTQWRGQANTPVVQGAKADEKTAGPNVFGAGPCKLKNLKARWEFSSATGTPIHPDSSEDALLATAIRMKETALPQKVALKNQRRAHDFVKSENGQRSTTASPAAKSQRFVDDVTMANIETPILTAKSDVCDNEIERPESRESEESLFDDELESCDELQSADASRIIDNAFDFMDPSLGSKLNTPSPYRPPAPLAQEDQYTTPSRSQHNRSTIVEEDVLMNDDEEVVVEEEEQSGVPTKLAQGDSDRECERKGSSRMPYSVSFYRKIQRERVGSAVTSSGFEPSFVEPSAPPTLQQWIDGVANSEGNVTLRQLEDEHYTKKRLRLEIQVAEEHISQTKRALNLCNNDPKFRGAREEVESQRALLMAVEKRRALTTELERLEREGPRIFDGPRGDVMLTMLNVPMTKDYVHTQLSSSQKSLDIYYFVSVLRCGEQVDVSKLVCSDQAISRKGNIEFAMPLQLKALPSDFVAVIEIYGLRTRREQIPHEEKYNLKGATLKGKSKTGTITQSTFATQFDASFNLVGSLSFNVDSPSKLTCHLQHPIHPLDGTAMIKIKKNAIEASDVHFRGFLSMYQRTGEGLGSWNRYWSVLNNGEMKFWRHPEDEANEKSWLVLIDLATCATPEGASTVTDICPYPNSFHIDVWVPKQDATINRNQTLGNRDIEKLRVMLAADTAADLNSWISAIRQSAKQLCTWRSPYK